MIKDHISVFIFSILRNMNTEIANLFLDRTLDIESRRNDGRNNRTLEESPSSGSGLGYYGCLGFCQLIIAW